MNASQSWNHGFPARATGDGPHKNQCFTILGSQFEENHGLTARGADVPHVGTNAPQAWNYGFRVGIASLFPSLEPWGPSSMKPLLNLRELHFSRFVNYASQRDMCLIFDTFFGKGLMFPAQSGLSV